MTLREIVRSALWLAGLLAVVFLVMTARFHFEAKRCLREGEAALAQSVSGRADDQATAVDQATAIDWFDRAIRAHSLLDGPGQKAAVRLRKLAEEAEAAGDMPYAIDVYQTLLSALAAIDTGLSPARNKAIRELETKVADLRRAQAGKIDEENKDG